jgi:hypothetical protein
VAACWSRSALQVGLKLCELLAQGRGLGLQIGDGQGAEPSELVAQRRHLSR